MSIRKLTAVKIEFPCSETFVQDVRIVKDMAVAESVISDRYSAAGMKNDSALGVSVSEIVRFVNTDSRADMDFYARHAGVDYTDATQACRPGKPVDHARRKETDEKTVKSIVRHARRKETDEKTVKPIVQRGAIDQDEFMFKPDPKRQAAGMARVGHKGRKSSCPDKAKNGERNFTGMTQPMKRTYWRWSKLRANERLLGKEKLTSWEDYLARIDQKAVGEQAA